MSIGVTSFLKSLAMNPNERLRVRVVCLNLLTLHSYVVGDYYRFEDAIIAVFLLFGDVETQYYHCLRIIYLAI